MNYPEIIVFGRNCIDYIAIVDEFPREDQKVPLEFRLEEAGGQGGTSSCCISRLGGSVAYIGKVGDDEVGRFCLNRLKDFRVNTKYIEIVKKGRTPIAYVFVTKSNGKRTIIYDHSTLPIIEITKSIEEILSKARVVLLDPEVTYLAKVLRPLAEDRFRIIYDCERWRDGITDIMEVADYFVPTADFLDSKELPFDNKSFFDKIFRLKEMLKGEIIVTKGIEGAYYIKNKSLYHVPAIKIRIKDTIGAGDNFHAALAYAINRDYTLDMAVKLSVTVASLSCREYGGRNGIPNLTEAIKIAEDIEERLV
ncbi:MAG: carbohydrate kinase family protein [Spirochaetota bacterium]|nr:carbohydrate kinase family protein [Spirochaetota bacterium]